MVMIPGGTGPIRVKNGADRVRIALIPVEIAVISFGYRAFASDLIKINILKSLFSVSKEAISAKTASFLVKKGSVKLYLSRYKHRSKVQSLKFKLKS